jgi:ADP-ribose pyrophosphatase YjhB (NUDIX family)
MTSKLRKWELLESEMIALNPWNALRRDRVRLPDGTVVPDYYISVRPDVATVFPLTADRHVVLVRQYKHGAGDIALKLPAGAFDAGSPVHHAARELREETGYEARHLRALAVLFDDATKNSNRVYVFLGLDVTLVAAQMLDDMERSSGVEVVLQPLKDIAGLILGGEMKAQSSVAASLIALNVLKADQQD